MATNTQAIEKGMDVYDVTGNKIGTVGDVYNIQAQSETSAFPSSGQGSMFEVNEGGVMGIGATKLYIPFSYVQSVKPGDSVTLNMTKEQAEAQGATKPDFLDQLT